MKALLIFLLMFTGVARADAPPEEQARAHFRQGRAYLESKVYDKAIEEFSAAYKLTPLPDLIFNIAQAYRLAGDLDRALAAYKQYLAVTSEGEPADESRAHVAELTKILDERNKKQAVIDAQHRYEAQLATQQNQAALTAQNDVRSHRSHYRTVGYVVTILSLAAMVGGFYTASSDISGSTGGDNVGSILLGTLVGTAGLIGSIVGIGIIIANPDPPPVPLMPLGPPPPGMVRGLALSWTF